VLKDRIGWIFGVVGIIVLSMILMSAVKIYKYFRTKR
jgi:putative membrane protein